MGSLGTTIVFGRTPCIRGYHPNWDEYRQAMADQGKSVIGITPTRWSPVSKGVFPPHLFED
jgi:hypothetical protein